MMTITEMAKRGDLFFTRAGWQEGQFIHAESVLANGQDVPGGMRVCNCHAPITTADPLMDDDLWMVYEGPECEQMTALPPLPSEVLEMGLPREVLAALAVAFEREREREKLKAQIPDLKPWQVSGKTMQA